MATNKWPRNHNTLVASSVASELVLGLVHCRRGGGNGGNCASHGGTGVMGVTAAERGKGNCIGERG
jgi:hypothetical protein